MYRKGEDHYSTSPTGLCFPSNCSSHGSQKTSQAESLTDLKGERANNNNNNHFPTLGTYCRLDTMSNALDLSAHLVPGTLSPRQIFLPIYIQENWPKVTWLASDSGRNQVCPLLVSGLLTTSPWRVLLNPGQDRYRLAKINFTKELRKK